MKKHRPDPDRRVTRKFKGELADLIDEVRGKYGQTHMLKASLDPTFCVIPTGIFMLDVALSGGWAQGRPAQLYGYESCGKTTALLRAVASTQRKFPDMTPVIMDAETTFNSDHAEFLGVDTDNLLVERPETGENAVDIIDALAHTAEVSFIGLDSIPALVPQKEQDDSAEDAIVAVRARLVGRMCSKLTASFIKERARGHEMTFMSVNQWRNKIGVMMGDPRTLPGGLQQNYFHMTKVEFKSKEIIKDGAPSHIETEFLLKKWKTKSPTRHGMFKTLVNNDDQQVGRIDDGLQVFTYAKRFGIIKGKKPRYVVEPFGWTFDSQEDIIAKMRKNQDLDEWLRFSTLAASRMSVGLPALPPDDYLVSPTANVEERMKKQKKETYGSPKPAKKSKFRDR